MNFYDSERMEELLYPMGFQTTKIIEEADVIIVNTCHIREKASEKIFSELGRIKILKEKRSSEGKETIIVVAGCVAQAEGNEVMRRAPYVNAVLGPEAYHNLPDLILSALRGKEKLLILTSRPKKSLMPSHPIENRGEFPRLSQFKRDVINFAHFV